jgi:hypothetical protein
MNSMFSGATAFNISLCGGSWVFSRATKAGMFHSNGPNAGIATVPCSCQAGTIYASTTGDCTPCPRGKYQDEVGKKFTVCTKLCSIGKYGEKQGLKSDEECSKCSAGRWSDQEGLRFDSECTACVGGKYSVAGSGQTSASVCKSCIGGKYSDAAVGQTAETTCEECARGKYSDDGPAQTSASVCKSCAGKSFSLLWTILFSPFDRPLTHKSIFNIVYFLLNILGGKYSDDGPAQTSDSVCKSCAGGKYSDAGIGQIAETTCKECAGGKYSDAGPAQTTCKACAGGKYSNSGPGQTSIDVCNDCTAGRYSAQKGLTSNEQCEKCPRGKHSNAVGATSSNTCSICSAGKYAQVIGLAECKNCEPGRYLKRRAVPSAEDHEAKDKCLVCRQDEYQPLSGMSECKVCRSGLVIEDLKTPGLHDEDSDCYEKGAVPPCEDGKGRSTNDDDGGSEGGCDDCPAGKYANDERCVFCPSGFTNPVVGQTKCKTCAAPANDDMVLTSCAVPGFAVQSSSSPLKLSSVPSTFQLLLTSATATSSSSNDGTNEASVINIDESRTNIGEEDIPSNIKLPLYSVFTTFAVTTVAAHRFFPTSWKRADLLFAGDHFINDSVRSIFSFVFAI